MSGESRWRKWWEKEGEKDCDTALGVHLDDKYSVDPPVINVTAEMR